MPSDVGIVMPVYEQEDHYLKLAVRSILRQSYRNFHLVIVLDGSPPHTKRLVRRLVHGDRRVHVVSVPHNHGVASALNRGFQSLYRHSQIRYLTWVSSDNIYRKNYIYSLRKALRRHGTHTGLVYSGFRFIDNDGNPIFDEADLRQHMEWMRQPKENLLQVCFTGPSFMYKRRHAEKTGSYQLEPVEDYDFWLRLTEHCDMAFVPKILMDYRVNSPHSVSRQLNTGSRREHRRWRVSYHTAIYTARKRRGIGPEVSVIIPIGHGLGSVRSMGRLFEQSFTNLEFLLVDLAPDSDNSRHVRRTRDPRMKIVDAAGLDLHSAVQLAARQAQSPLVLLWSSQLLPEHHHLQSVMDNYRSGTASLDPITLDSLRGQTQFPTYVQFEYGLYPVDVVAQH